MQRYRCSFIFHAEKYFRRLKINRRITVFEIAPQSATIWTTSIATIVTLPRICFNLDTSGATYSISSLYYYHSRIIFLYRSSKRTNSNQSHGDINFHSCVSQNDTFRYISPSRRSRLPDHDTTIFSKILFTHSSILCPSTQNIKRFVRREKKKVSRGFIGKKNHYNYIVEKSCECKWIRLKFARWRLRFRYPHPIRVLTYIGIAIVATRAFTDAFFDYFYSLPNGISSL